MNKRAKQVILIFLAVAAASARIDFTGSNNNPLGRASDLARSKYPNVAWFPGKSFCNCGSGGNITNIDVTKCETPPCNFYAGDDLTLQFEYVTENTFPKLDLNISLVDQKTGASLLLRHLRGTAPVQAGEVKSTFVILSINASIPHGKDWYFEILRTYDSREICARFPVTVINNSSNSAVSMASVFHEQSVRGQALLPQLFRLLPFYDFTCPGQGSFPDPQNCTKFHQCQLFPNGTYWDTVKDCPPYTVWCQESSICDYPSVCPCELPQC